MNKVTYTLFPLLLLYLFTACTPKKSKAEIPISNISTPKRIVSLSPILTEILYELDQEKQIIGVTRYCDRPKRAQQKKIIAGFNDIQVEQILALKPDFIVASNSITQQKAIHIFKQQHIPVWQAKSDSLKDIYQTIQTLSARLNQAEKGTELIQEIKHKIKTTAASLKIQLNLHTLKSPVPKILILIGHTPLIAAGEDSYPMEIIKLLGLKAALTSNKSAWPVLSLESLVALKADYIILAEGKKARPTVEKLLDQIPFSKNKITRPQILVPSKSILMRPGLSLKQDVQILGKLF